MKELARAPLPVLKARDLSSLWDGISSGMSALHLPTSPGTGAKAEPRSGSLQLQLQESLKAEC